MLGSKLLTGNPALRQLGSLVSATPAETPNHAAALTNEAASKAMPKISVLDEFHARVAILARLVRKCSLTASPP